MKFLQFTIIAFLSYFVNHTDLNVVKGLEVGDSIPYFSLIDHKGKSFDSYDYLNKQNLIIFFFNLDSVQTCDDNQCNFRDSFKTFNELDAKIVGISSDNIPTINNFLKMKKLPYTLLSDHRKKVHKIFGFKKSLLKSKNSKVVYIVNKKGIIRHIFNSHKEVQENVNLIIESLKANL